MDEHENPYRPGAGTQPPALLGRDDLISRFEVMVRRARSGRPGQSVLVVGLRGVGKTVLLRRFQAVAEESGIKVAAIEASDSGDFSATIANRLRKVLLNLTQSTPSGKVKRALQVLKTFSLQLPEGAGSITLNVDALTGEADSGNLSDDLSDLFAAVGEAASDQGTGILIAIDELQYLTAGEFAAVITAIHRTTQEDLPVLLVGAGLPQVPSLVGQAKSYAERLFEFVTVGSLTSPDAEAALRIPANERGVEYTEDAIDEIFRLTQGYPYFLQEWGYRLWNEAAVSPINFADVSDVTENVVRRLDENFFRVRLDRLTPKERQYLTAMAALGAGPHRSGDIAKKLGVKVERAAPRRSDLIVKGMIYAPAHGMTAFTVPLFDEFLRRQDR